MNKKRVTKQVIPNNVKNQLSKYIQRQVLSDNLTNITKSLQAAVQTNDKSYVSDIRKRHKELCKRLDQLSEISAGKGLEIQYKTPENLRLANGMSLRELRDNNSAQISSGTLFPTDAGNIEYDEDVSGKSKAQGFASLSFNHWVDINASLNDNATPDPLPHFASDSYSITQFLQYDFPPQDTHCKLVWTMDTCYEMSFVQGSFEGSASLGWGAFGYPNGSSFPMIIGPFLNLVTTQESYDEDLSENVSISGNMIVNSGKCAKLWLCVTLTIKALYGLAYGGGRVFFTDGFGNRGIYYYFVPL